MYNNTTIIITKKNINLLQLKNINLICLKKYMYISLLKYQLNFLKQHILYINFQIFKKKYINTNIKLKGYRYIYPYWTFFFNNQTTKLIKISKNLFNTILTVNTEIEKNYKLKTVIFLNSPLIKYVLNQKNKKTIKIINKLKL